MTTGAAEMMIMMLQCVGVGTMSLEDESIDRRPYHKYCRCALHNLKGRNSSKSCLAHRNISFPIKRSQSCSSLTMDVSKFGSQGSSVSASPAINTGILDECLGSV